MRNTFNLILIVLVLRCYSVPMSRQRREIDDDDIAKATPVLDNDESIIDRSVVRQTLAEKVPGKESESTESPKPKAEQQPSPKPSDKIEQTTKKLLPEENAPKDKLPGEKRTIDVLPGEKMTTKEPVKATPLKPTAKQGSTEKPNTQVKEQPNKPTNVMKTPPTSATNGTSDEELTSILKPKETRPTLLDRVKKMWSDFRSMSALAELWNKIKAFFQRIFGMESN